MRFAVAVAVVLMGMSPAVTAQSSITFGSSSALLCFQASQLPLSTQGLSDCNKAIRGGGLTQRDLAATYANRGIIYAANGRLQEAIDDYDKAIAMVPTMGQLYNNRGNAFHRRHEYESALEDYDRALELAAAIRDTVHYNKALTLILMKRWDEARESLEAALAVNPNMARARRKLEQFANPDEQPGSSAVEVDDPGQQSEP